MSDAHAELPGQPHDDGGPVFREPWEAQVFAVAVALHQRGVFSWSEWSQALAAQISTAQSASDADLDGAYYHHWLTALEKLVIAKGASSVEELARYHHAWSHAAGRTPHGQPLDLQQEDFAR